jgi:hypothetical protein
MSPKSTFTVPLGNVVELVTETQKTHRGNHTSEKQVPFHTGKEAEETKLSSSRLTVGSHTKDSTAQVALHPSDNADELHPLQTVEEDFEMGGNNVFDLDMEGNPPPSNVCVLQ